MKRANSGMILGFWAIGIETHHFDIANRAEVRMNETEVIERYFDSKIHVE